jgi:hypothetical protein
VEEYVIINAAAHASKGFVYVKKEAGGEKIATLTVKYNLVRMGNCHHG